MKGSYRFSKYGPWHGWAACLLLLLAALGAGAQRPELIIPATHSARSILLTPNDGWLVSAGAGGIKIWENRSGRLLKNWAPGGTDNDRFNGGELAMAADTASRLLAVQVGDTVYFFNFETFTPTQKWKVEGKKTALSFSADGATLFMAGEAGEEQYSIERLAIGSGTKELLQKIKVVTPATNEITSLSVSPGGRELLVYNAVMGSWIIDLSTKAIRKSFNDGTPYRPYAWLPNGNLLAFGGGKEKTLYVGELEAKTFSPLRRSKAFFKETYGINTVENVVLYIASGGRQLLSYQGEYVVLNPADLSVTDKYPVPRDDRALSMTEKGNIALSAAARYFVRAGDMTRTAVITNITLRQYGEFPLDSYVQFVLKHTDGVSLKDRVLTFENGVFNQRLVPPVLEGESNNGGFLYRLTADGKTGFLYNDYYGLYRFDPTKARIEYEPVKKINDLHKKFVGLQIFEAQNRLALIGDEGIYMMDLQTLKVLYIVDIPFGLHYVFYERLNKYCDLSPDGSKLILFAEGKEDEKAYIYCVDLSDRNEKWKHQSENIQNLRFVDGGRKLLFTSNDQLVYLDAETGQPVGEPVRLPKSERPTILSGSGAVAATEIPAVTGKSAGSDIGLVDVESRKPLGTMRGTGDAVDGFVFLRNERYMLTEEWGGLCLWDLQKQRKIAKIYLFEGSADWVLLAPDGRFDATPGALKKMYFAKGKEVIPLESLYEKYYVPGLLKQVWNSAGGEVVPDINELKSPPVIRLSVAAESRNLEVGEDITIIKTDKEQVVLKADADGGKDVVSEIRLYQNGKLVEGTRNLTVENDSKGEKMVSKSFTVTLNEGANTFRAVALNSQRTESLPAQLVAEYKPVNAPPKPASDIQLHLLVVGVNTYKNPKYSLNYATADAAAFTDAISRGTQGLFGKVNTTYLKDDQATKEGLVAAFEKIKAVARPQDLFVFYYAGHGVINDKKEFFLVPYDVTQLYGSDDALAQKGFSAAVLQQMSKEIRAQKQLFILDACQSAGALEMVAGARGAAEEKAIAQLARSTGTQWLTASGSEQFASEFSQLGHGSFTYCLLEAFRGDANPRGGKLTVKELDAYLQTKVPEVTQKYKGTPQYPASYSYGNDFPIIIIKQND